MYSLFFKENKMNLTIIGHEVEINIPDEKVTQSVEDTIVEKINTYILDGSFDGSITVDGVNYDWNVSTYLSEKARILEAEKEVVFEHNQFIYQVFQTVDGEYEYSKYSFSDFTCGETLDAEDGGVFDGSAKDAIDFMIED
jgi:hypothetical protein